jgi:NAD-dependent deacetylase
MPKIVLFTGAGTSAEAGIPTFRTDKDSFWSQNHPTEVANIVTFRRNACDNREKSRAFHNSLRKLVETAEPTRFHHEVRSWQVEARMRNIDFHVITQNVDDLFEKAGVSDVQHVHGDIRYMQCLAYNHKWFVGYADQEAGVRCPRCNCGLCKPGTVFFDEDAPLYPQTVKLLKSLGRGDALVVAGTSCAVFPLEKYLANMRPYKVFTALEMPKDIARELFDDVILEPCTAAIDAIKAAVGERVGNHIDQ